MLRLTLTTVSLPCELDGKKYELREMVSSDRDKYLDTVTDRVRVNADGKPAGIKKFDGMYADLVSRCLFHAEGESAGKAVDRAVIQRWPASAVSMLFSEAQKLNLLNEDKEKVGDDSKND